MIIAEADNIAARDTDSSSANNKILTGMLRHRSHLAMVENDLVERLIKILALSTKAILKIIRKQLEKSLKESVPILRSGLYDLNEAATEGVSSVFATAIAERVIKLIEDKLAGAILTIDRILQDALEELTAGEAEIVAAILKRSIPAGVLASAGIVITNEVPVAAIKKFLSTPLGGEMYSASLAARYSESLEIIKLGIFRGLVQGAGMDMITNLIKKQLADILPSWISRLVRTEVMRNSNKVLDSLYSANSDIIKKVQFIATLDFRTCMVCGMYDSQVFSIGKAPEPPLHPNCRCLVVPITKSWRELGADIDDVPLRQRASMNGTVPAAVTFEDFFNSQDDSFKLRVLGQTRFDMWQSGRLNFSQFVTGEKLRSVAELKSLVV